MFAKAGANVSGCGLEKHDGEFVREAEKHG